MLFLKNDRAKENTTLGEMKEGTAYTGNSFCIDKAGAYQIKLHYISSIDNIEQGILVSLFSFKGRLSIDGDEYPIPKRKYPKVLISQNEFQTDLEIQLTLEQGMVIIMNASYDTETDMWNYYTYHHLLSIEKISDNILRCRCRSRDEDESFSDLVFDMEITKRDA